MADWSIADVPTGRPPKYRGGAAEVALTLEPVYSNRKKGGTFKCDVDMRYVQELGGSPSARLIRRPRTPTAGAAGIRAGRPRGLIRG
jgi:hypothetical protein